MQRNKLLALAVGALAVLAGASLALLGNAQATTWHDYAGDLYAGHAYGLQVPPGALAYEVTLAGEPGAAASIALFDPAGKALGHHALDAANPAVKVEDPAQGRHVLYVYDLQAGALKLRVDAPLAPLTANLQKMPVHKTDVTLAQLDAAAPLDVSESLKLDATPVFLTLLYEGSVQGLDATIASEKGNVVTIRGESGTAFAPGVWSHLAGERASDAANLEGLAFTVKATAARFEGTLVLTRLAIDQTVPEDAPAQPQPAPGTPPAPPAPVALPVNGAFAPPAGKPIAFTATAGALRVGPAEPVVQKEGEEHDHHAYWTGALAVYRPDDSLLAYVELSDREPAATIKLPQDGEYVVYVHEAPEDGLLVQLVGASSLSGIRELAVATEEFDLDLSSGLFLVGERVDFEVRHAPVAMTATLGKGTDAVLSYVYVENANGVVLSLNAPLQTADLSQQREHVYAQPENFAAGAHAVHTQGVIEGTLHVVSTYFLRQDAPAEEEHDEAHADHGHLLGALGL